MVALCCTYVCVRVHACVITTSSYSFFLFFSSILRVYSRYFLFVISFFLYLLAAENNGSDTGVSPQTPTDEAATPTNAPISPPTSSLTPNSEAALGDDSDYLTGANVVRIALGKCLGNIEHFCSYEILP